MTALARATTEATTNRGSGSMKRMTEEIKAGLREIGTKADAQLDVETLKIIDQVLRRVRFEGWTDAELGGYLDYRKGVATREDEREQRERMVRVKKALKTDRWGLATVVARLRAEYDAEAVERRNRAKATPIGRPSGGGDWFPRVEGKKSRSSKSGRRRRKKVKPSPWYLSTDRSAAEKRNPHTP